MSRWSSSSITDLADDPSMSQQNDAIGYGQHKARSREQPTAGGLHAMSANADVALAHYISWTGPAHAAESWCAASMVSRL
jgi:hypothetical protein